MYLLIDDTLSQLQKELDNMVIENPRGSDKIDIHFKYSLKSVEEWSKDIFNKPIINHPVISVFLRHLWFRECLVSYAIYLTLYIIFCILHVTYLISSIDKIWKYVILICICTLLFLFFLVELAQLYCKSISYFLCFENVLELALYIYTILSLCHVKDNFELKAYPFGYNIGLLFIVLFCIIGEIPKLSKYIILYKKVLTNFILHMIMYSLILIGFSLMFHDINVNETGKLNKRNISSSIFNMYIRFFGEFNSDEIKFETLPYHYMVMFLVCLLCVPMVLSNVLIALTISDMQSIKNEAELSENLERINSISSVRKLNDLLDKITKQRVKIPILKHKVGEEEENTIITAIYENNHSWFRILFKNIKSPRSIFIGSNIWKNFKEIKQSNKNQNTLEYMTNLLMNMNENMLRREN